MPFTVTMPKLSPTMEEGTIAKWHKREGERVEAGDLLVEIATDKATIEYAALDEGWLRRALVKEGESRRVNQPIAIFTALAAENIEGYRPEAIIINPEMPLQQAIMTTEPAQETFAVTMATMAVPRHVPEPPLKHYVHPQPFELPGERVHASPLAKRLAVEKGRDLRTVKGSGPGGRITSKDVEKAQPEGLVTFGRLEAPTLPPGTFTEEPLSPMRKAIARRLQESKSYIPHFYVKQVVEVDALMALREQLGNWQLKVSYNDLVIRAAALALREHPHVNAGFHSEHQTIVRYQTVDIGVAVTLEEGLITPLIRHADFKNVGQIAVEMKGLATRAREGKLVEEEYKGGSFCISNLGMYGITEFSAVINPPQGAILAVGAIEERPVIKKGKVVVGHTLTLVLSADHRVIDGALAAQFMKTLQKLLENPTALIL